ncbi:unnamed protein product [Adineta ricciae]|uniref:Elongin-A n=1 Tax=Adineta ricciae TaxID=249248 RepID=A0A814ZIX4_ADIRI|nr:unnamed protein product [Adineta ricciae]
MSSGTAITMIESVKNKLNKYIQSKDNDKVKEYLQKLHHTSMTPALLRETKIDVLVKQLVSDTKTSYYTTAKGLLDKWHNGNNKTSKSNNSTKVKTITNTTKVALEKKSSLKRKCSDEDDYDKPRSSSLSESHSSDDGKPNTRDQSSPIKKRKVLSLAEYTASKKPVSAAVNRAQDIFTDTQIQEIYAKFDANGIKLAANAPKLPNDVSKILTKDNDYNHGGANGYRSKTITNNTQNTTKQNDIWAEDDDDDDDDAEKNKKPPLPVLNKATVDKKSQQVKKPTSSTVATVTKKEERATIAAIASSIASLDHSQPISRPPQPQLSAANGKKSESFNFLRPRQGRQAIYSGKRACRTSIPSLQDLCVDVLKDNIEDSSRWHFNRLPYEIVKPILDVATPDQLYRIIDNNPDYYDDVQPLWQKFCSIHYKDAELDENETYFELYWRKFQENEARLQKITELAKKKKAQTTDIGRQTKSLPTAPTVNRHTTTGTVKKTFRPVVGLPPTKLGRGQAKPKKPVVPPLLRKTLKSYTGKN